MLQGWPAAEKGDEDEDSENEEPDSDLVQDGESMDSQATDTGVRQAKRS